MKRERAIETINELPKEFDLDELIERLIFIDKVEAGLTQLDKKKSISHDKVKKLIKKWQK